MCNGCCARQWIVVCSQESGEEKLMVVCHL